jgi:DNA polymerase V
MFMNSSHGGKRTGAGRPKGSGRYGEKTLPLRVPLSLVEEVKSFLQSKGYSLPLYSCAVSAGMLTAADDHVQEMLDLHQHLIRDPESTFCVKVQGDSMINASIHEGDLLIVDRHLEARHGKIVIAAVDGQLTVKRLHKSSGKTYLMPENEKYPPIELLEDQNVVILGVVTRVLHEV